MARSIKITGVNASPVSFQRGQSGLQSDGCLVEVTSDAGITGISIVQDSVARIACGLSRLPVLDSDARATAEHYRQMVAACSDPLDCSYWRTVAAVDSALWDLKSRLNSEPLWKTLGGSRPFVNVHAHIDIHTAESSRFDETINRLFDHRGLRGAILQLGADHQADHDRLALIRDNVSGQPLEAMLMVECPESHSPEEVIERIQVLEKTFDLACVEIPPVNTGLVDWACLSDSVAAAICGGRYLHRVQQFLPAFRMQLFDVVQIDIHRTGITGALQIADAAFGLELPVLLTRSAGDVAAHLAMAQPNFMSLEIDSEDIVWHGLESSVDMVDGKALSEDGIGNGVEVDYAAMAAMARTTQ